MQLQVLLWEAAGRIRLERRGEDGMLEVVPNEEAQQELDEIDARNARAAANVAEPAAEDEPQCEPPLAVPEHVPALARDLGEGAGVTGAGTGGAEGALIPEGFCAW